MAKATVSDKDFGFKKIMAEVKKMEQKPFVKVGVQGADAAATKQVRNADGTITAVNGITVVEIANFHEYGLGVPERSFIRATLDENRQKYVAMVNDLTNEIWSGRLQTFPALGILGQKIVSDMKLRITNGIPPPLAQATIDKKKSSKPLIDTGQLWQSITYVIEEKS